MISTDVTNPKAFGAEEKRKIVSIGLIQTTVSDDIADNMKKTIERIEEASRKGRSNCLPPRTLQNKVFSARRKTGCQQLG